MNAAEHTPKRRRSPSYPAIDLEAAIDRALALYRAEGRNVAPNDAILAHWGYSPKSGPGFGTLGALKRFGLLQAEGPGKSRLSDLALRIILDDREQSPEYDEALKEAALTPKIHREIWEKYQDGLPSDATLRHFLRFDKGFTDSAADELIAQFRKTVSFANLAPGDSLGEDGGDSALGEGGPPVVTTLLTAQKPGDPRLGVSPRGGGLMSVPIPLSATEWVTLQGPFPVSEQSWEQLMRVLDVMKPGLVASPFADDVDETD
jgi:hypothetical protein